MICCKASDFRGFSKTICSGIHGPVSFVVMDKIPLTTNGKIDRNALPVPDNITAESEIAFLLLATHLELQLTKIWENVLGVKRDRNSR